MNVHDITNYTNQAALSDLLEKKKLDTDGNTLQIELASRLSLQQADTWWSLRLQ
jgi:hypothetical protein